MWHCIKSVLRNSFIIALLATTASVGIRCLLYDHLNEYSLWKRGKTKTLHTHTDRHKQTFSSHAGWVDWLVFFHSLIVFGWKFCSILFKKVETMRLNANANAKFLVDRFILVVFRMALNRTLDHHTFSAFGIDLRYNLLWNVRAKFSFAFCFSPFSCSNINLWYDTAYIISSRILNATLSLCNFYNILRLNYV